VSTLDRSLDKRLAAQPVQLLEIPGGIIIKRGVDELVVPVRSAAAITAALARAGAPGGAPYAELLAMLQTGADGEADGLIQELRKKRMLVDPADVSAGTETPAELLGWGMGRSPNAMREAFASVAIDVIGVNAVSQRLVESLLQVGARVRAIDHPGFRNVRFFDTDERLVGDLWRLPDPTPYDVWDSSTGETTASCLVVCSDFGGLQRLAEWNGLANRRGWHFLPAVLQNAVGLVGPLVIPGETACFQCLLSREEANSATVPIRRALESFAFEGQLVAAYHPSMASATGDVAAIELTKQYAYGWTSAAIDNVIEINLLAGSTVTRPILKVPNCRVCSTLNSRGRFTPLRASEPA
jgi:bacteriocin biosynthesis cyclodehydratase domain-containing protein